VAHCPASNAKLGHGIAPLSTLLNAGARVGLGTDSVASNDRLSVLEEARLAALFAAAREQRNDVITSAKALELATLGGATALGLEREIGSLEAGKSADLAAFPMTDARTPIHDPVSALVYALAGAPASFVTVSGVVKVWNGELVQCDPSLSGRVQLTADLLQSWKRTDEVSRTN
jgi:5-methylthioadenosine/S-adenosylhomocysteine deaminase